MSSSESRFVVLMALAANVGIAVVKFVAAAISGSAAVALAGALACSGEKEGNLTIDQGDEVGAPSRIEVVWGGGMVSVGGGVRRDEVRALER